MREPVTGDGQLVPLVEWHARCASDHTMFVVAELLQDDDVLATVDVIDGSVVEDRSALHRSNAEVVLADDPLGVDVGGWEFRVWKGVLMEGVFDARDWEGPIGPSTGRYIGGSPYLSASDGASLVASDGAVLIGSQTPDTDLLAKIGWVSLGVFAVQRVTRGRYGVTTLEGIDRSQWLSDARLEDAWPWAAAGTLEDAVKSFVTNRYKAVPMDFVGETHARPKSVHERESDPWEIIVDAAASVGYETFFNGSTLVWRPEPDVTTSLPDLYVDEDSGTLLDVTAVDDREGVYNSVIAYTSDPEITAVVSARVYDNDPQSVTYYEGRFGKKPAFYASPLIKTTLQAQSAARTRMYALRAASRAIDFTMVPNPALQVGDVVAVRCEDARVDDVTVVEEVQHPLSPLAAMGCRSTTITGYRLPT